MYIIRHFTKVVTSSIKLDSNCRLNWYMMIAILQKGKADRRRRVICAVSHRGVKVWTCTQTTVLCTTLNCSHNNQSSHHDVIYKSNKKVSVFSHKHQ